jgi:hypothetical protein
LRRIAATTDRPIYYLGAEYLELLADPVIFDDSMGSEAVGDRSLDSGQSFTIGEKRTAATRAARSSRSALPFQAEMYRHASGCRELPPLRGVPAATFGGGVVLSPPTG